MSGPARTIGRVLDLFDVEHNDLVTRWEGLRQFQPAALVRMPNP